MSSSGFAEPTDEALRSRILYILKTGQETNAFNLYNDYYCQKKCHDAELLEQMATILIEQGFYSDVAENQVLSIYGAGISNNEKMLDILKAGISSKHPEVQLICLNFLSAFHHDEADTALMRAMNSDYLLIRLEAGLHLAEQKVPKIVGQIESLMQKVDKTLHPLFPQFFALIGTQDAIRILSKLLNHENEKVRVQAIISAANFQRDDLLPNIRKLATQGSILQQEACAYALGKLKDETSIPKLESFALSHADSVRLTALQALYNLGQKSRRLEIESYAKQLNLFAIHILSEMDGSDELLINLRENKSTDVRVNATLSLLKLKNKNCLPGLLEILIRDSRDLAFFECKSLGGTLKCIKTTPSAFQNLKNNEMQHEVSLNMREEILTDTLFLAECDFLKIAKTLLEMNQHELIPVLSLLLESLQTDNAISLLKLYSQKAGAPLIRNYCNLALFRLKENGPYKENLEKFVLQECTTDLIQFRPLLPFEKRGRDADYQLTPHDTSRLLVEAFEALTTRQDEHGINILLHAIEHGNPKNKYALAGLLMHAAR
jgi:hypothetical protein